MGILRIDFAFWTNYYCIENLEKIDFPIMYLMVGKKRVLDIENYRQEVIK